MAPPAGVAGLSHADLTSLVLKLSAETAEVRRTVAAPLRRGFGGHCGGELGRFVLSQYHEGQVTMPRRLGLRHATGIMISERQLVRLLEADQDGFLDEARDVLRAGLISAAWITVDDTAARPKAVNGFCTQDRSPQFAWFGTTQSKNRRKFLELLDAGHCDAVST